MIAVDLFAGLGGFTEGARQAGVSVAWAANHWPLAVALHRRNHPRTTHACQDLQQADWSAVPRHDLLLASPACQGHAYARGAERPHHDAARSTAWAAVTCAEVHRPAAAVVENVPEFTRWTLYPAWRAAWAALGYQGAEHVIDAADFGLAHRRRLFVVFTRSAAPLRLELDATGHRPASELIDPRAGGWSAVDRPGRAASTLARVAAGRTEHGARFLISYYGSARGGRSLARPLPTITTRARHALVDGPRLRMISPGELRGALGFPSTYALPDRASEAIHLLGNAVAPTVAAALIRKLRAAL